MKIKIIRSTTLLLMLTFLIVSTAGCGMARRAKFRRMEKRIDKLEQRVDQLEATKRAQ